MGCRKHDSDAGSCVCDAVVAIKEAQDAVDDRSDCRNSCFNNLLSPTGNNNGLDTVPFVLQNKKGNYFFATGALGRDDCFQTVFFRVEKVDEKNCCATLSLLRPDNDLEFTDCCVDPESLCDIDELERTRFCIEVDLDCFCAIQCLDPNLVGDIDKHKCK
ncbi:CotY/CotZ family spore coat protein [Alteribacillus bidgolensis]|uniref:Spore coat protein Y/spore coat protein Z n=1 Tax=Alteribacillus bidgolensis TaxID=930129 RepID=A0A1G8J894_9BACI|nr:CotY/CotZ family spore coat protein [Alteribacillus bidgolensis]SDI27321.1 spore coat protein Y/spore coat protein Z [Alteribacillus bidgolensis]